MDLLSPTSSSALFEEFLKERRFLKNVTPSTIEWYETAWKALKRAQETKSPALTKSSLQQFVIWLRQRDVKPISCNTYIKALNTFCLWAYTEGHLVERVQLAMLKVEERILVTLTDEQIQALLTMKPRRFLEWRPHALVCLLLDTSLRVEEALTLHQRDVDFDNLLVTVFGKGRKERRIPFSFELRKVLFRYEKAREKQCPRCDLVFPSRQGTTLDQRNSLRGLHLLQKALGLPRFGCSMNWERALTMSRRTKRVGRVEGFALDDGEYIEEVRCVTAPIRDPQGEIVASVGISAPLSPWADARRG